MVINDKEYKNTEEYIKEEKNNSIYLFKIAKLINVAIFVITLLTSILTLIFLTFYYDYKIVLISTELYNLIMTIGVVSIYIEILLFFLVLIIIKNIERNTQMIEVLHKKNEIEKKKDTK